MRMYFSLVLTLIFSGTFAQNNNRIIVKFKEDVNYQVDYNLNKFINSKLEAISSMNHLESIVSMVDQRVKINPALKRIDLVRNIHFLSFPATINLDAEINNLQQTGLFQYIEKDAIGTGAGVNLTTPNDTYFSNFQWSLKNTGTFSGTAEVDADIDMDEAWDITTGDANTIVCVLDAGFKLDHPELAGRIWQNPGEIAANGIDDDGNGYIDDTQGWDWANNDNSPADDHGHGTNVASIITAKGNNASGMSGINWNCKLMVGKILNSANSGFYTWWESGIYYAVTMGAKVINMSVGGSSFSASMGDACDFAMANNVMIAVCMHNQNTSTPYYPAAYASVIAVGSTSDNDNRTVPFPWDPLSGSNYGSHIDLVAPGNLILGAYYLDNTSYNYWAGTSQATPEVAGVISLMLALKPDMTFTEVRNVLATTSQDQVGNPLEDVPGWDQYYGYGRLNARAALNAVLVLLPLKFGDITAQRKGLGNEVSWSTFEDFDTEKFQVEYTVDRTNWQTIAEATSLGGTSNTEKHYSVNHLINNYNDAYYRIKAVKHDGTYFYSKIVKVKKQTSSQFSIDRITSVSNTINVYTTAANNTECTFSIYSMDGKLFYQSNKKIVSGNGQYALQVNLSAGRYQLVATTKDQHLSRAFLIR